MLSELEVSISPTRIGLCGVAFVCSRDNPLTLWDQLLPNLVHRIMRPVRGHPLLRPIRIKCFTYGYEDETLQGISLGFYQHYSYH